MAPKRGQGQASVGLSPATVPLSSPPLLATSPAAVITQTRNSGESALRGPVVPGNSVEVAQKTGRGVDQEGKEKVPLFCRLAGTTGPLRLVGLQYCLWPCRGRQCKDEMD